MPPDPAGPLSSAVHAERLCALTDDLLAAVAADGRLVWANPAWEHELGWPIAELLERSYLDVVEPEDQARVVALAEELARTPPGATTEVEVALRGRAAGRRLLRFDVAVADGLVYLCGKDVTDLRRRTDELERSNEDLERFASVVSHDLRQGLLTVTGFLQLLERRHGDALGDRGRSLLAHALEGGQRMESLLTDLLAYARMGTSARAPERVDVAELVARIAADLPAHAEGEPPEVTVEPGLPTVTARPQEIEEVLANLLVNAVKFVEPGRRARVCVRAEPDGSAWRFEVADNGIGVPPEERERIFGVFERVRAASARPGSGIGLAIAQKAVERAGGRIWVRAGEDGGSVFAFTWPAS